jgi:hypothetical protein
VFSNSETKESASLDDFEGDLASLIPQICAALKGFIKTDVS